MKIKDYDTAIFNRFKEVYSNTFFVNNEKDAIQEIRDKQGSLIYPHISVMRVGIPVIIPSNRSHFMRGQAENRTETGRQVYKRYLFQITYQLDVRAKSKENYDDLLSELQMNIMDCSMILLNVSEEVGDVQVTMTLTEVVDNSDLEGYKDNDQVYRGTVTVVLEAPIYRVKSESIIETAQIEVISWGEGF